MRMGLLLRLQIAVLVFALVPLFPGQGSTSAAAQSGNGFIMDATRMCDNGLAIRWDQRNVEKIEFTASNTSDSWASDWIVIPDLSASRHYEMIGRSFDKVMVRATFADGSQQIESADTGMCSDKSSAPHPSLEEPTEGGGGGHAGPVPADRTYYDPETGNRFAFVNASRMCDDNRLIVTWTGDNIKDLMFTAYDRAGWETGWLQADPTSGVFTTDIDHESRYYVDAGVYFTDGHIQTVVVNLTECTPVDGSVVPDAGIGENSLVVQISMPNGADISGSPWHLYAPQAAAQAMPVPYLSGFVGADNTIRIDGLVPDQYRLVVYPAGSDPVEALITVADQPVTVATLSVAADGKVTVEYAAQAGASPTPETATPSPQAPTNNGGSGSGTTTSGVTGLPSTGAGSSGSASGTSFLILATALTVVTVGSLMIRRKSI